MLSHWLDDVGLTGTGVESQVRNISVGPLQLSQDHGTHSPALLIRPQSLGPAPAPKVDGTMHVALRSYHDDPQGQEGREMTEKNKGAKLVWFFSLF